MHCNQAPITSSALTDLHLYYILSPNNREHLQPVNRVQVYVTWAHHEEVVLCQLFRLFSRLLLRWLLLILDEVRVEVDWITPEGQTLVPVEERSKDWVIFVMLLDNLAMVKIEDKGFSASFLGRLLRMFGFAPLFKHILGFLKRVMTISLNLATADFWNLRLIVLNQVNS